MRETRFQRIVRQLGIACMLVAFLFQPLAMQMLRADDLIRRQGTAPQAPVTIDLRPGSDAALRGRLVTPRGSGVSAETLQLTRGYENVLTVKTDPLGYFILPSPSPGVYQLTNGTWVQSVRIWASGTAPPAAKDEILIVAAEPIVAGQVAPLRYWMANPNVMLATAAIAIVVPILLFNKSQDRAAS